MLTYAGHIRGRTETDTEFWCRNLKEVENLKDPDADRSPSVMYLTGLGFEGLCWTNLAQENNKCLAVVNTVMNN
jgi:hypothetical protein